MCFKIAIDLIYIDIGFHNCNKAVKCGVLLYTEIAMKKSLSDMKINRSAKPGFVANFFLKA